MKSVSYRFFSFFFFVLTFEMLLQNAKHSGYSSRSCSTAAKNRDVETAPNGMAASITTNWDKVYIRFNYHKHKHYCEYEHC